MHGNFLRRLGLATHLGLAAVVVTGCAAPPPAPLGMTGGSAEALARLVLGAVAANDLDELTALALNGQEFRDVVWPELPASRPERGVPVHYAWNDLHQKSRNALGRLIAEWGGRRLSLVRVSYDGETTAYETFRVHRETRLTVRDETGDEHELHLYGSTLVRDNEHKVFSYVVD